MRRIGLYFQIRSENVVAEDVIWVLRQLHRHLRRPIILVWDRSGPHRKAVRLLTQRWPPWLQIEWLPAYAPDLNPTEQCWNHAKQSDLANSLPDNSAQLRTAMQKAFSNQRRNQPLLHSYFDTARLPIKKGQLQRNPQ